MNRRPCAPIRGSDSWLPNTAATWDSSDVDLTALWSDEVIMEWIAGVATKNTRGESSKV